ncbi:DUF31 family protein [Mycoplasma putrefaciens]|uniref:Ig-specific serine endopeptidase MIP n=1 Tax=Mycoplasma putrefaciens TaxID=2123 RepID=UPI003DA22F9E
MKFLNKMLVMISVSSVSIPSLLVVACSGVVSSNKNLPLSKQEIESFISSITSDEQLKKVADLSFVTDFGHTKKLSETLPTEIQDNPGNLKVTLKDKRYNDNIKISVQNASTSRSAFTNISNTNGTITIFIEFLNRKNNDKQNKKLTLTGLSRNAGFDHNSRQQIDPEASFGGPEGIEKYNDSDQKQRFKRDNKNYIETLQSMYNIDRSNKPIDIKKQFGLNFSEKDIQEFNKKADDVNFDSYYNAALKGFTLPVYDENNNKKLKINDAPEVNKGPSFTDFLGVDYSKSNGLARTLINETYKTIAKQTFQVKFTYLKDFAEEIALLKKNIELINSWDEQKLKDFKEDQVKKLEIQHNIEIESIQREVNSLAGNEPGIKREKEKLIEEKISKYNARRAEILNYSSNDLKSLQTEEIKKLETKKEEKQERAVESGTMWIMDYQLGVNPTTFYFGTNSHVAKALTKKITAISITRIKESVEVGQTLKLNSFDPNFETFTFDINENNKDAVSAIFHATDFVKSKPSDYLVKDQAKKYKDAGFYADFAVVEFDFEKLLYNKNLTVMSARKEIKTYEGYDSKKIAALITNNYVTNGKHIKFKSDSYLTNYKNIDRPILIKDKEKFNKLENLYILGYPTSESDYYLKQYEDKDQIDAKKQDFSLWINADSKYFGTVSNHEGSNGNHKQEDLERGNFLSYQIGYRSFIDKPGLTDAFLAAHRVGNDLYTLMNEKGQPKQYFNFGLELMPRFYAPSGGASGSSVRNKDNELIAVYHASNNSARTGLATMLRSPGYDYKGLFENYNLPQYDLIYGTGHGQINSYRHSLETKYGTNDKIRTKLFEDGFNKNKVPEKFKFNSTIAK